MYNLQLVDTLEGGHFVFDRNDYLMDQGIYSELYCCLFATNASSWWGDSAFDMKSYKIASRTENAIRTYNTNTGDNITLIRKAILDDLERLTFKNPSIIVESVALVVYTRNSLGVFIKLTGNTEIFKFIYQKTRESLTNIEGKIYCEEGVTGLWTADSITVTADSEYWTADGGNI